MLSEFLKDLFNRHGLQLISQTSVGCFYRNKDVRISLKFLTNRIVFSIYSTDKYCKISSQLQLDNERQIEDILQNQIELLLMLEKGVKNG